MSSKTSLYTQHQQMGAKLVDFGGWQMPLHYGSQLEEHHIVRRSAGMFDVSHMTLVDLDHPQAGDFLRHLLANNIDKLDTPGRALYSCMLQQDGGVVDDLIVYWRGGDSWRVVVNAATRDKDLAWIEQQLKGFDGVEINVRDDLSMVAIQGPQARQLFASTLPEHIAQQVLDLKAFHTLEHDNLFIAATGYTGEDGVEVIVPNDQAAAFWQGLATAGVKPCGLGARDTLRLEAGMNLYGADMDETTSPLESGLGWTLGWKPEQRDFVGRSALTSQRKAGIGRQLRGLVLEGKGVLRNHVRVSTEHGDGEVTSGSYSPTLEKSIALARLPAVVTPGDKVEVDLRGRMVPARVVKYPFVRNGQSCLSDN